MRDEAIVPFASGQLTVIVKGVHLLWWVELRNM